MTLAPEHLDLEHPAPARLAGVRRSRRGPRPVSAAGVLVIGAVAYLAGGLLNADTLRHRAESLPLDDGWRPVALAATAPLLAVSDALGLTRPGEALDAWHGVDRAPASGPSFALPVGTAAPEAAGGSGGGTGGGAGGAAGSADATTGPDTGTAGTATGVATVPTVAPLPTTAPAAGPATTPTAPVTTAPAPPSAERPLSIYIAGDSMAQGFGQIVEAAAARTGVMRTKLDVKVSSGLNRVDFFDWPARLVNQVDSIRPDVVVVTFGGNDQQPIVTPEGVAIRDLSDPAWAAEYGRRVGAVMDYLSSDGRRLIWVGVPNDSRPEVTERLAVIRAVYQAQAAARPRVVFLDAWTYFESPSGGYAAYVADETGEVKRMRANDGFHLSIEGASYLGRLVFQAVVEEFQARGGTLPG